MFWQVLLVLQKLLPILPSVLQPWISDSSIIECLCDMIKKAVRTLMEEFAPLVGDSVTLLTQMYTAHPHPPLLDLAKQASVFLCGCIYGECKKKKSNFSQRFFHINRNCGTLSKYGTTFHLLYKTEKVVPKIYCSIVFYT